MMITLRQLGSLLLGCTMALQAPQALSERLTIVGPMVPGLVTLSSHGKGEGLVWEGLLQLEPGLSGLKVHFEAANVPRLEQMLSEGRKVCAAGVLATEARDRIGYVVPFIATPPLHLVVRAATTNSLPLRDGAVDLERLLGNARLRGVLADMRPYPGPLQSRLRDAVASGQLSLQRGGSAGTGQNLLLMISNDRADYTFEYPTIVHGMRHDPLLKAPLLNLPIAGFSALQESVIYCPRTPWGRINAERLERAVALMSARSELMMEVYSRWLPESVYRQYRAELEQVMRQRAGRPSRGH